MIQVTNEMIDPPEGLWEAEDGYRAIINPEEWDSHATEIHEQLL